MSPTAADESKPGPNDWRATSSAHWQQSGESTIGLFDWLFRIAFGGLMGVICVFAAIFIFLILFSSGGHHDSRRSEGEQLMGSARDFVRVEYSKHGKAEATREPFRKAVESGKFTGKYFSISPDLRFQLNTATLQTAPGEDYNSADGTGYITFEWALGKSAIDWR